MEEGVSLEEVLEARDECEKVVNGGLQQLLRLSSITGIGQLQRLHDRLAKRVEKLTLYGPGDVEYELYNAALNMCVLAEATVSYAIEKVGGKPPRRLSEGEKKIVEDLERFRVLGCYGAAGDEECAERLAKYISSDRENIRKLIVDFLEEAYERYRRLLDSKEPIEGVSPQLVHAAAYIYERYFDNVRRAVIKLLEESSSLWIRRLFSDYTYAILESLNERRRISGEREKVRLELSKLISTIQNADEEIERLVSDYQKAIALRDIGALRELLERLELLRRSQQGIADSAVELYGKLGRLEEALAKREQKLRELEKRYEREADVRAALEAEIDNLRRELDEIRRERDEYARMVSELKLKLEEAERVKRELIDAIEGRSSSRLITRESAHSWAVRFAARLRSKLKPPFTLRDPAGRFEVKVSKWDETVESFDEKCERGHLWRGLWIYKVRQGWPPLKRAKLIVDAYVLVGDCGEASKGYYTAPVGVGIISRLVEKALTEARDADTTYVLVVASPTGFTREAVEFVAGGPGREFVSDNVLVALYDPLEVKLYTSSSVYSVRSLLEDILEPYSPDEKAEIIAKLITEGKAPAFDCPIPGCSKVYDLDSLVSEARKWRLKADRGVVLRAFEALERTGEAVVLKADDNVYLLCVGGAELGATSAGDKDRKSADSKGFSLVGFELFGDDRIGRLIGAAGRLVSSAISIHSPVYGTAASVVTLAVAFAATRLAKREKEEKVTVDKLCHMQLKRLYELCKLRASNVVPDRELEEKIREEAAFMEVLWRARRLLEVLRRLNPELASKLEEYIVSPGNIEKQAELLHEYYDLKREAAERRKLLNDIRETLDKIERIL